MQSYKKIKSSVAMALLLLFIGNNPALSASTDQPTEQGTQQTLNLSGLYLGFFPCADCQGVRTTLALNKNNSYVFMSIYVGKSDREFTEKGKFTIDETNHTLILTPRKGSTTVQKYLIDGDVLVKLDEDGNRITQDGADSYIMKRKDVISSEKKHSGNH